MTNVITTYGGGELFGLVFNGIAALFKKDVGILIPLMNVSLMVGLVYVVVLMLFRSSLAEGLHWLLWVIVATNLIFLPKTRIHIHDPLTHYHQDVDNMPLALGVFAGFVSNVGKTITEKFETNFSLPNYMPYHQTGTVFASSLMSQVGQFRIVDPEFKGNMERFVNQCVVYNAMMGQKYTLKDLQNTPDIWTLVKSNASPILGFLYKEGKTQGTILTCKDGAQKLEALWTAEIDTATAIYGSTVQNQKLTKTAFLNHLQNGYQLLTTISGNATKILQQEMMVNALEESSNNKLSELGSPSNYAATKALLQQRSTYAAAGEIAARTLPLFKNVIEALSYSLFIFIVVLALLPNGYRVLMTYFGILVWTQLWAPLYAVLNLIMTVYGTRETTSLVSNSGLTILNSSAIINANTDMVTLAAWLSVSIPFISYGILKQGAGAFVGLAHHLGSAMQASASSAAAETVSGNISLGNVSMGTQAYQNTSAFQHNTSPSYNASQFRAVDTRGIEQTTFADGTQAFTDQAMSHLSVDIMGTENTSFAKQASLNNALNVSRTASVAANESTEAGLQKSTNFLSRFAKDDYSGEDFNHSVSANDAKSLSNFKNLVSEIRHNTDFNEAQAVEAAIGASIGLPKLISLSGSGNFTSSAARQEAIATASSLAKQTGYSENIEKLISSAQSASEGNRDTNGADLGEGAMASLNKGESLREEASVAQTQADTLSKEMNSSQSKSFIINKNLTQDVLEFIAQQPTNNGPSQGPGSQIGYERARHIIEQGGEERAAYLQRFQETHPQYAIQSINASKEEADIKAHYETESHQTKAHANTKLENHTSLHNKEILTRAKEAGIDSDAEKSHATKKTVEDSIKSTNDKIKQGTKQMTVQENALQEKQKTAEEKTLGGTAIKNLAKSAGKGVISVAKDLSSDKPQPIDKTPYNSQINRK